MRFFRFIFLALSAMASTQTPVGKFTYDSAILVDPITGLPYSASSSSGTPSSVVPTVNSIVNRSGTITTGGTSQQLFAASTLTKGFIIYNNDTTELLCFNAVGGAATAGRPHRFRDARRSRRDGRGGHHRPQ